MPVLSLPYCVACTLSRSEIQRQGTGKAAAGHAEAAAARARTAAAAASKAGCTGETKVIYGGSFSVTGCHSLYQLVDHGLFCTQVEPVHAGPHLPAAKRRKAQEREDLRQLQDEYALLRKVKKGKITTAEFDKATGLDLD